MIDLTTPLYTALSTFSYFCLILTSLILYLIAVGSLLAEPYGYVPYNIMGDEEGSLEFPGSEQTQ